MLKISEAEFHDIQIRAIAYDKLCPVYQELKEAVQILEKSLKSVGGRLPFELAEALDRANKLEQENRRESEV